MARKPSPTKKAQQLRKRRTQASEKRQLAKAATPAPDKTKALPTTGGSPSHKVNMTIRKAKESLMDAFEKIGGVDALVKWGKVHRTEFYRIWARLIPREVQEEDRANNLEELLTLLAERGGTVAVAAMQIGPEAMGRAQEEVAAEDAQAALTQIEGDYERLD